MIRMLIRIGVALAGAALGFIVAALVLDDFALDGVGFVIAVAIFVALTAVLEPFVEKVGDDGPAVVAAGSSLITTFLALLVTDLVSDGLDIEGLLTWVLATLIVWAATALATLILLKVLVKRVAPR